MSLWRRRGNRKVGVQVWRMLGYSRERERERRVSWLGYIRLERFLGAELTTVTLAQSTTG